MHTRELLDLARKHAATHPHVERAQTLLSNALVVFAQAEALDDAYMLAVECGDDTRRLSARIETKEHLGRGLLRAVLLYTVGPAHPDYTFSKPR